MAKQNGTRLASNQVIEAAGCQHFRDSTYFFNDEKKVYAVHPEKAHCDVGYDCHDLPFQIVQKLL
jgi:hypothetical protein